MGRGGGARERSKQVHVRICVSVCVLPCVILCLCEHICCVVVFCQTLENQYHWRPQREVRPSCKVAGMGDGEDASAHRGGGEGGQA
jgi:hypothetical protein